MQKEGDSLVIEPSIPASWQEYVVHYRHQNTMYHIFVRNPHRVQSGVVRITLDGVIVQGAVLLTDDRKEHQIEVLMG